MDSPAREGRFDGVEPGGDSGFASINFLAAADKADDHGPIRVPVEIGDEKLGFGLIKTGPILFSAHEIGRHFQIPSALGFVENDNVIARRAKVAQSGIAEVMHVLDERLDLLFYLAFANFWSVIVRARELIPRKSFGEDLNQRAIARQENGMSGLGFVSPFGRN